MSANATRSPRPEITGADGFIIVAVLWILAALAILASVCSVYVVQTATAMELNSERIEAEALVKASLDLAVMKLTATKNATPSIGRFSFRLGGANVAVDFRSEAGRIDLNAAPKELLVGMFAAIGVGSDLANAFAARIIGWRTPAATGAVDNEAADYRTAGLPYGPRLGPFLHPSELSLVMGLPPAVVERALPLVTTYSALPQINVMAASPEVLAALPGVTPDRLYSFLAQRGSAPQNNQDLPATLGPAQGLVTVEGTRTNRITVRTTLANGRRMSAQVVILVFESGNEPYGVLSWRDDFDSGTEVALAAGTP